MICLLHAMYIGYKEVMEISLVYDSSCDRFGIIEYKTINKNAVQSKANNIYLLADSNQSTLID